MHQLAEWLYSVEHNFQQKEMLFSILSAVSRFLLLLTELNFSVSVSHTNKAS